MNATPETLRPCPFCGGVAEYNENGVSCSNINGCDFDSYTDRETWNLRPGEDALRAEIDRLRATLAKIVQINGDDATMRRIEQIIAQSA